MEVVDEKLGIKLMYLLCFKSVDTAFLLCWAELSTWSDCQYLVPNYLEAHSVIEPYQSTEQI